MGDRFAAPLQDPLFAQLTIVGVGLIGRAWSIVYARAGFDVVLWDQFPQAVPAALDFIAERLPELKENGLLWLKAVFRFSVTLALASPPGWRVLSVGAAAV